MWCDRTDAAHITGHCLCYRVTPGENHPSKFYLAQDRCRRCPSFILFFLLSSVQILTPNIDIKFCFCSLFPSKQTQYTIYIRICVRKLFKLKIFLLIFGKLINPILMKRIDFNVVNKFHHSWMDKICFARRDQMKFDRIADSRATHKNVSLLFFVSVEFKVNFFLQTAACEK